jgi:hypothetical protein
MNFDWKVSVPWLLSVVTVAVGIWQYADKQAQANREPFLKKQLDLVFEASETVSKLANLTDPTEWRKAKDRFWILYWGPLGIVENQKIETCMGKAGRTIPQSSDQNTPSLPLVSLQATSIELSHVAREFILESWNVDLSELSRPNGSACD